MPSMKLYLEPEADTRTMADLAREALAVQDACNLSGVVHGFSRSITRLRALLREAGQESTHTINTHPVCQMWADKIASLAGLHMSLTATAAHYEDCEALTKA